MAKGKEALMNMRMIGLDKARKQLSELIREVRQNNVRYILAGRGKPQAIVLSVNDFLLNFLKQKRLKVITELQLEAEEKGRSHLSMAEINAEIRAYRKEKAK